MGSDGVAGINTCVLAAALMTREPGGLKRTCSATLVVTAA
jgi:hypothetical protein